MSQILSRTGFAHAGAGWRWPAENAPGYDFTAAGAVFPSGPARSFRAGESIARAYVDLYRQLGGARA